MQKNLVSRRRSRNQETHMTQAHSVPCKTQPACIESTMAGDAPRNRSGSRAGWLMLLGIVAPTGKTLDRDGGEADGMTTQSRKGGALGFGRGSAMWAGGWGEAMKDDAWGCGGRKNCGGASGMDGDEAGREQRTGSGGTGRPRPWRKGDGAAVWCGGGGRGCGAEETNVADHVEGRGAQRRGAGGAPATG
uniref:Uncharacterized protein n=1 Tax=Arundo donax TaxID=35708 RepID=A0A0A9FIL1_ARUDO